MNVNAQRYKWLADVRRLLPVRSQFVLSGEVRDLVLTDSPTGPVPVPLLRALWLMLHELGYQFMLVYDPIDGARVYPPERGILAVASNHLPEVKFQNGRTDARLDGSLIDIMRAVVGLRQARAALVMDFASRLTSNPSHLEEAQHSFFVFCEKLSLDALPVLPEGSKEGPLFNPVIWLLNRGQDLPSWLLLDSERISTHTIPSPSMQVRDMAARMLAARFADSSKVTPEEMKKFVDAFTAGTNGMSLQAMTDVAQLASRANMGLSDIGDALRAFKIGEIENPWKGDLIRGKISEAAKRLEERVKGQPQAITKTVDILMRSAMGLTGAQARSSSGRPRGTLFFAGPTGVGKTELAKTLTESLFGDEQAYIRFDMSEFSEEHTGARLLGAPPGYVGYDAGGELTNAVRERPFSVILFDEIEKAHPRLLDKFLQILEDGRLTDGRGETTYFSESVIIFTSNLGHDKVKPGDAYDIVEQRMREAIKDHFRTNLKRPEILNRIGENIVVFNYITPTVAILIFDGMMRNVLSRMKEEHGAELVLDDKVSNQLLEWATADLANGGRGIGNHIEMCFINPLARALFSITGDLRNRSFRVAGIAVNDNVYSLELSE